MKKVILGLGLAGILGSSAFAGGGYWDFLKNEKSYFCSEGAFNILEKGYFSTFSEETCAKGQMGYIHMSASADAVERIANRKIGTFNNELLMNKGIGVKLSKGWKNIDNNYNEFLCTLSKRDRVELFFFGFSISNQEFQIPKEDLIFSILNDVKTGEAFPTVSGYSFIETVIDGNVDRERINKFFGLIMSKKYSEARDYMKEINQKSGYIKILDNIEKGCKVSSNKTSLDILNSIK